MNGDILSADIFSLPGEKIYDEGTSKGRALQAPLSVGTFSFDKYVPPQRRLSRRFFLGVAPVPSGCIMGKARRWQVKSPGRETVTVKTEVAKVDAD